jgi:hypothetical protein
VFCAEILGAGKDDDIVAFRFLAGNNRSQETQSQAYAQNIIDNFFHFLAPDVQFLIIVPAK